jgi:DNA-binding CsgD family transcriptional regulator
MQRFAPFSARRDVIVRDRVQRGVAPAPAEALTARQRQVYELVSDYYRVAHEMPSMGWVSRRLQISRERARQHVEQLRNRGCLGT